VPIAGGGSGDDWLSVRNTLGIPLVGIPLVILSLEAIYFLTTIRTTGTSTPGTIGYSSTVPVSGKKQDVREPGD
jgi:hypothetical protein